MNKCVNKHNVYNLLSVSVLLNIKFEFLRVYYI